jgi:selenocysteine lyase/cysteine desulfurase
LALPRWRLTMPQNAVRLSFHVFISEQDVQRLLAAVEEVLRSADGSASANGNVEVAAQVQ